MIPVDSLRSMPERTRWRKMIRVFYHFENQIGSDLRADPDVSDDIRLPDVHYIHTLAAIVAASDSVPGFARDAAEELGGVADYLFSMPMDRADTRERLETLYRAMNAVRHGLMSVVGEEAVDWDLRDDTGALNGAARTVFPIAVYLDDLRSPFNVGAIFRAAEAFGVSEIIVSPATPTPEHVRTRRSAMGAETIVPWRVAPFDEAAALYAPIIALESGGTAIGEFDFPAGGLAVLGSEELGVSSAVLERADRDRCRVTIPMAGAKRSLNVSVAAGIFLHAWYARLTRQ